MNSLDFRLLVSFLSAGAEVQALLQLWLAEGLHQPLHVLLQRTQIHVLQILPGGRDHGVALVSELSEAEHHGELFVSVSAALHELTHVLLHFWSKLESVCQLTGDTHNKHTILRHRPHSEWNTNLLHI